MELQLSEARITWSDGKDFSKPGMGFGFKAVPLGFDNIKLKTGETFGGPMHKRVYGKGDEPSHGILSIGQEIIEQDGREWRSEMRYIDGTLFFSIRLPESQVKELQNLILAGNVPGSAHIFFEREKESGFSYGNLPDGRDMTWDNEIHKKVAIQSVRFDNFSIPGYANTSLPEDADEEMSSLVLADAKFREIVKEVSLIRYGVMILVLMLGLVLWNHR